MSRLAHTFDPTDHPTPADLDYVQVYRRHPLPTLICDVSGRCIDCNDAFIVAFRTTHTRVTRGQNVVHLGEGAGPKDAFMTMRCVVQLTPCASRPRS